jgi:SAM-dependent methyltransferase
VYLPRTADLPQRIAELYEGDYLTGAEFGDYASQHATFARNFRAYLRRMQRAGATGGRLLEVGCAYGFFLEQAQASFEVTGIDVNEAAITAARSLGVPAICGDFLAFAPDAPYDVVCMWDTVEHLLEPLAYLDKARAVLRDGGWLFLTTGDIGSAVARFRGPRWRLIHPPSHVNYFSRQSMSSLLGRTGFDVVSVAAIGTSRDLRNALHVLSLFSRRALVRRVAAVTERLTRGLPSVGVYLNLRDIMFVTARSRGRR